MGKGKGAVHTYVCKLPSNAVLFEFYKIQKPVLVHLCNKVAQKLTIFLRYYWGEEHRLEQGEGDREESK